MGAHTPIQPREPADALALTVRSSHIVAFDDELRGEQRGVMGVTYRVDVERRLLVVVLAGVVTDRDLDRLSEEVRNDPSVDPAWPVLVDASTLNPSGITAETLRARASVPRPNPVDVAIVAPTDVVFGLARMFQMVSEGRGNHIEVFRYPGEALAWLATGERAE
jgi:hypothetical protein